MSHLNFNPNVTSYNGPGQVYIHVHRYLAASFFRACHLLLSTLAVRPFRRPRPSMAALPPTPGPGGGRFSRLRRPCTPESRWRFGGATGVAAASAASPPSPRAFIGVRALPRPPLYDVIFRHFWDSADERLVPKSKLLMAAEAAGIHGCADRPIARDAPIASRPANPKRKLMTLSAFVA